MPGFRVWRVLGLASLAVLGLVDHAGAMVLRTIQVAGQFSDWQGVLADPANAIVDRPRWDADPDRPADGTVDLRRFAVTWDETNLYLYWERTDKKNGPARQYFALVAYIDSDGDSMLGSADSILLLRFNNDFLSDAGLFAYLPVAAEDPMPGDGQLVAGRGGVARPATIFASAEQAQHARFEVRLSWASLGGIPGRALRIQPALTYFEGLATSAAGAAAILPTGIQDNGAVLDTSFRTLALSPGQAYAGPPGGLVDVPHRIALGGNRGATVDIGFSISEPFRLELWSDPNADGNPSDGVRLAVDEEGNGSLLDALDVLAQGADTNGDLRPDTGPLAAGASYAFVIRVVIPGGNPLNGVRTLSVTATPAEQPSLARLALNEVRMSRLVVLGPLTRFAEPGATVPFFHKVCSSYNGARTATLAGSSALGWPVSVRWAGAPATSINLAPGECVEVELRASVPAAAPLGTSDLLQLQVESTNPITTDSVSDVLQVSAPLTLTPDASAFALAGDSVYLGHTLRNATDRARVFNLATDVIWPDTAEIWTDPNGDGLPGDGLPVTASVPLPAFGGEAKLLLQIDVPRVRVAGERLVVRLTASDASGAGPSASATDTVTVRLLETLTSLAPGVASGAFPGCSSVRARAGTLVESYTYRFRWSDPQGSLARLTAPRFPDATRMLEDTLALVPADPSGTWQVSIEENSGGGFRTMSPGGPQSFEVQRNLQPQGGLVAYLATNRQSHPQAGQLLSITAALENTSPLTYERSSVDYLIYRDANRSGAPDAGEAFMQLDGSAGVFSGSQRTCRTSGLASISPADSRLESQCATLGPMAFPSPGSWTLRARWFTDCGDTIAERSTLFNVGCNGVAPASAGPDRLICQGQSTELGGGLPQPGYAYAWSPTDYLGSPTSPATSAAPPTTRGYTLGVLDAQSCVASDEVLVVVTKGPLVDPGPSVSICPGASVRIGTPALPGHTYAWSPVTGLSAPNVAQPLASPAATTTYTLTVTENAIACPVSRAVVVSVGRPPAADAGADTTIGSRIGPATCDPGHVHVWSPAAGLDDPTACNPLASPATTTSYCLTVRNAGESCASAPDCVTVYDGVCPFADPGPDVAAPSAIGPATCKAGERYSWAPAGGLSDPTACRPIASPAATTVYCLTVEDIASGCVSGPRCVTVSGSSCPVADAGPDVAAPALIGPSTCSASERYSWTPVDGLSDPTACRPTASPAVTTVYCLTVENIALGCVSPPACVTVGVCATLPPEVPLLRASRRDLDVRLAWDALVAAEGGYRVYREAGRERLGLPAAAGLAVASTALGAGFTTAEDLLAAAPPPAHAPLYFYRVVGRCADGSTEGP